MVSARKTNLFFFYLLCRCLLLEELIECMKLEGSLGMKVPNETNYLHIYIKHVVLQHLLKSKWK